MTPQESSGAPLIAPFNLQVEQGLLGGILLFNEGYDRVADFLTSSHFYLPPHVRMFEIIGNLVRSGRRVTAAILRPYLADDLNIDGMRSVDQYLDFLVENGIHYVNAEEYGQVIRDLAIRRELMVVAEEAQRAAANADIHVNTADQLEELERKIAHLKADHGIQSISPLRVACVAGVEPRAVRWLWPGRLAAGHMTLLVGQPGDGKSQISLDITARITTGARWPDGRGRAALGNVVILSAEDSLADVIRPRLEAAGAELKRAHVIEAVRDNGRERNLDLQTDLAKLKKEVNEIGDVRLVIIDPITSYMGTKIDSHRTTDVRSVLEPLARFAEATGVAVLAISHPPKAAQAKAINMATGSLAFVAAARLFFVTATEPETERRLLLPVKNNLGPRADGIGYHLAQRQITNDIVSSHVEWDSAPVTVTADEAMQQSSADRGKIADAKEFLRDYLAAGPMAAEAITEAASRQDISERTLRRARKALAVIITKSGFRGQSIWSLPEITSDNVVSFSKLAKAGQQ